MDGVPLVAVFLGTGLHDAPDWRVSDGKEIQAQR